APAFEQWQQVAVALDRLVESVLLPCLVAGPQQVPSRLVLVVRPQPVVSEQAQHLGIATRVPLLEPLCRPPMQSGPLVGEQRPISRLLDESVAEAVFGLRPAPALAQEAEPLQLVERIAGRLVEHPLEERQRKGASE